MYAAVLETINKFLILIQEKVSRNTEGLCISDTNTLLKLGLDTGLLEQIVELRPCTMDNYRIETDGIEECQARAQFVEVIGQDGTAHLDDGKALR